MSVSTSASLAATNPPAAPPSALPSVPVITSTSPVRPKCSMVPRPVSPMTPVPCESSTTTMAPCARASVDDLRKVRQIAFHREHAVGHDDDREAARDRLQLLLEIPHVAVLVSLAARFAREANAVDDRGVIQLVRDDRRALIADRREENRCWRSSRPRMKAPASVPRNDAIRRSSVRCTSKVPHIKRTDAVPAP